MISANKTELTFEPAMPVSLDQIAETATPAGFQPVQGVMAWIPYKPAKLRYVMRASAVPTSGEVIIRLMAGTEVLAQVTHALSGAGVIAGTVPVSLAGVAGDQGLSIVADVTTAADAGIVGSLSAVLDIEQPLTNTGC